MDNINFYSDNYSEKEKDSNEYLKKMADNICNMLVYDKDYIRKAYNYYNGKLDKDQYRYLEENYGIGSPTSVEFIPLIRRHIDVLVGRHLSDKIKPKITCKDKDTLTNIFKEKQRKIYESEINRIKSSLYDSLEALFDPNYKRKFDASDEELEKLKHDIDKDFISEYETSAQHMINFFIQNRDINLSYKLKTLFLDILIVGQCFYKITIPRKGETPDIEILNPLDVFYERNEHSPFIKDSTRAVVRRYLDKQQIISRYGSKLSNEDIEEINTKLINYSDTNSNVVYVRTEGGGLVSGVGVSTVDEYNNDTYDRRRYDLYPVYEIEWISNNKYKDKEGKTRYRMDRYEVIRIGQDIHICLGKDDDVIRSIEHPDRCTIKLGGVSYNDRNGTPFSLVLATASLQDKYNVLFYQRDALIASSGIKGDFLDVAQLPSFLGKTPQERLIKWNAYKKKLGIALINTAQDGSQSNLNTIYKGYDDTLDGNAINALQLAINQIEEVCSSITGVYRESLGSIEQKDAVTNVETGIKQSNIITKQYFSLMDNITSEVLKDALNAAKISYKEGMVGSIILGNKLQKVFTIDPQKFSFTDYDVHIADNSDIVKDMQKIETMTYEFIKAGNVDADVIIEGVTAESLSDFKYDLLKSISKKKEEANQSNEMLQKIQQYEQELAKAQKEIQALTKKANDIEQAKLQVKTDEINKKYDVQKEANETTKEKVNNDYELDKKRTDIEYGQLFDGNPYNNKVKNAT